MKFEKCVKPARSNTSGGGGVTLKALTVAALATLCLGFGVDSADAQEADKNMSLAGASVASDAAIHNSEKAGLLHFVRNDISGTPTGFAAEAPTPTLDDMNDKASSFTTTSNYTLTTDSTGKTNFLLLDNGSGTLTKYWYTPNEGTAEKNNILNYLTGVSLVETTDTTNYVFTTGSKYYTFDMEKPRPTSAYTLTKADSGSFLVNIDGTTYNVGVKDQGTGDQNLYFKWDNSGTNRKITNGTSSDKDFTAKVSAGTGDTNAYYKWTTVDGNLQLTAGESSNYNLIAKYSTAGTTVTQTGNTVYVTATGTSESAPTLGDAGIIKNPAASISDTLYLNNATSANIQQYINDYNRYARVFGGAISNSGNSGINITANFKGNHFDTTSTRSSYSGSLFANSAGGAISNYATSSTSALINEITGDFIGNYINATGGTGAYPSVYGGAIVNSGYDSTYKAEINKIAGDFVGNYASSSTSDKYSHSRGGAISNSTSYYGTASISSIVGDFVGNYASSYSSYYSDTYGGAIYNYGTISSITGDFVGNYASSSSSSAYGGAIYNFYGTISSIEGDFVGNYTKSTSSSGKAYGGAIFNGNVLSGTPAYDANSKITLTGNTFTGNYVDENGTITPNSIYNAGIINIANGATVTINDGYDGVAQAQLNIGTGATSGSIFNLSVDNGKIQTDNLGTVTNNGTINWDLDVSLTAKNSDKIAASFADVEGNNKSIIINAINLITGTGSGQVDITLTTDSTLKTAYTLSDSILSHITKAAGVTYTVNTVDYDPSKGILTFNKVNDSLAIKVHTGDPLERSYTMTAAETVGENLGQLAGGTGAKLDVNGGGYAINGGTYTGITVSEGQTLTFTNVSDVTGFTDATAVTNGGTLGITGSKFTSKIANSGTMTLSGTNTLNGAISGANGATTVSTGTTTFGADLTQKDLTVASGAGVVIDADNLNITNAVKNDGTVTLSDGILKSSIANNTATTGKTVIDGDVTITSGKTVSQAMEVTAGTGHKLIANVASIGGAVTNNADLKIFSQDPITSETTHFNQNVTGSGTTTIQRNVNVDSTIANNVVIDKYVDSSVDPEETHYANVVVGSTGTLGAAGKTIVINAGDGTNYNTLSIGTGSVAADSITNNSKLVLNNSTSGTLSKTITGSGILNIAATGDNADNVVVGVSSTITNQAITVEKGIFQLAEGASLAGSSAVYVDSGAGLNSINGAINDYTDGTNTVTLSDGARVYVDITGSGTAAQIDKFIADESSTITLSNLNVLGAVDIPAGEVQLLSAGTVTGESLFIQSDGNTVAVQGTGRTDGTVKVGMTHTSDKLNGAVYVSGAVDAITYSITEAEGETVNASQPALGHIKDSFKIQSGDADQKTVTATPGTKGLIVDTGKKLTVDNIKFQNFATGEVNSTTHPSADPAYYGNYEGIITVKSGATLNVKNSYFAVSDTDGNTAKIAIANYGTLTSDPSVYEGGVMNNKGATFTVTGDTFQNIDRSAYDGGAIYNEAAEGSTPAGTITMNNVTATNNKAAKGGVLYNAGTATTLITQEQLRPQMIFIWQAEQVIRLL